MSFNPVKPREIATPKRCITDLFRQAGGPKRVMVRLGTGTWWRTAPLGRLHDRAAP